MNYHWNWDIFWELAPEGHTYLATLVFGLGWTLATAFCAAVIAFVLGSLVGVVRTLPNTWFIHLANGYVELFRNVPLLIQMFLWYFVLPQMLPITIGDWIKSLPNASFITAVICLGFYSSARVAVHISAAISALPKGQKSAALSLGFTLPQTYRHVLLPLTCRLLIPIFTNELLSIIKNSAVALTIGLMELTASAYAMQEFTFQIFETLIVVTFIYLLINTVIVHIMRFVERRAAIPGFIKENYRSNLL